MSASMTAYAMAPERTTFGFVAVLRLGIVQACLGALIVLITATMNRVMVVELGLPALVPGALVALHYAVQMWLRPRMGHFADQHGRLTRWIVLGMAMLATGVVAIAALLPMLRSAPAVGYPLILLAFLLVGLGVSTAGTLLLTLLSLRVPPARHARAAATVWLCMIAGFIVCTVVASRLLTPFSFATLVRCTAIIGTAAVVLTAVALIGLDAPRTGVVRVRAEAIPFADALRVVWSDAVARRFAFFVGLSMLAYSTQDLILEPFAGSVFGLTPAASTAISGVHQGGSLLGMLLTAMLSTRFGTLAGWARSGCLASAAALLCVATSPLLGNLMMLKVSLFALGMANGVFAIGAIGSMMALTGDRHDGRAGLRLGVFGAAQALAYATGTLAGAAGVDIARALLDSPVRGYLAVFLVESVLFAASAMLAMQSASRERAGDVIARRSDMLPSVLQA